MQHSFIFRRFGRLVVQSELGSIKGRKHWSCICDCGKSIVASTQNLNLGRVTSCGCARIKHNASRGKHPLYQVWLSMRERCNNPKCKNYDRYGGRGIKVDPRWDDFNQFVADMGERPPGHSIERKDNDGDYTPKNCRWATQREQVLNSSRPKWITVDGVTKHLSGWAADLGIRPEVITQRINTYGWTPERAVTTPKLRRRADLATGARIPR